MRLSIFILGKTLRLILFFLFLGLSFIGNAVASGITARAVVESTMNDLLEISRNERLLRDPIATREAVENIIIPRMNTRLISKLVMAKYWRRATSEQKDAFENTFPKLLVKLHSNDIGDLKNVIIEISNRVDIKEDGNRKTADVFVKITDENGREYKLIYQLVSENGGKWLFYNIVAEGLNFVTTFRSDITSSMKVYGIDAVITGIQNKVKPAPTATTRD